MTRTAEMARYLFAYGSLVDPASTRATLGRPLTPDDGPWPAVLHGYRREWNTASGPHSHPERRLALPDGAPYAGVLAVLGIRPDRPDGEARCTGAVLRISDGDLLRLVARERNYEPVEVTGRVSCAGRGPDGPVHAFVPRPTSIELLRTAPRAAIRRRYLQLVEQAFDRLGPGELGSFRATTVGSDLPVLDVRIIEAS
jgi:cation transport regulator ChaC